MNALLRPDAGRRTGRRHPEGPQIGELVAAASDVVAPAWPLKTFIAVNPLQGLEDRPFEGAVLEAQHLRQSERRPDAGLQAVNRELIKWCSVFFDEGQAVFAMPNRHLGLYGAFADLAPFDRRLRKAGPAADLLDSLSDSPEAAIEACLERLRVPRDGREEFLRRALAALPGWAGHVKWRQDWQEPEEAAKRPASLVDYLAVRLVLTCILWPRAAEAEDAPPSEPSFLAELPAREASYRDTLLGKLLPHAGTPEPADRPRPDAQLVFCIDVRSEPFRRRLEEQGDYETFGFAGFFGIPVRVKGYDDDRSHASCPVLLKPSHEVCERASGAEPARVRRHELGRTLLRLPNSFYRWLKYGFATPFALVELLGPWLGLRMLARTFCPSLLAAASTSLKTAVMPPVPTEPVLDGIPPDGQADFAESALRMMGLTGNLAPLVVLCGHGSTTTNNAYGSALDCGACGGNHGGMNARILASILNDGRVRTILAGRGLAIPDSTLFLGAEHDTTTDRVEVGVPAHAGDEHRSRIARLRVDLDQAASQNARDRCRSLGVEAADGPQAVRATERRRADWSEVRPEWGLARNAAFIVGPRRLTRSIDLEGRCFLHSYDWRTDPTGKYLATILTAPMVVAQWINSQYFFSALDNVAYGSGSKVTQNVTGKIGVMQGNASDLMHGLPLQSVHASDEKPYHEPLRLLTAVFAPREMIDPIIQRQEVLRKLFGNGWVQLACIEPEDGRAYRLNRDLTWAACS
ncbi:hypothetical protein OJF2_52890 [Aquisphaera giovannonii]|uniref:Probable inorganic carbon transporter subunit DabA n=1 Tax=Aquisphaera giovannonii TaxID=406548 RepID=A0A5B9W8U9_9BACT|nr:DUF2309 domain-containing protein [Aquisphaera giovannonii]QEH36704.1 hypothetical protein OJF2_52890 [Aquisphaera giovannonii]